MWQEQYDICWTVCTRKISFVICAQNTLLPAGHHARYLVQRNSRFSVHCFTVSWNDVLEFETHFLLSQDRYYDFIYWKNNSANQNRTHLEFTRQLGVYSVLAVKVLQFMFQSHVSLLGCVISLLNIVWVLRLCKVFDQINYNRSSL